MFPTLLQHYAQSDKVLEFIEVVPNEWVSISFSTHPIYR